MSASVRSLLLVIAVALATACDEKSAVAPTVGFDQRFTLARGETALVEGTRVRLQFVGVSSDSRCPINAICVQAGKAIVQVRLSSTTPPTDYELHTDDGSRARHGNVQFALVELQPFPFSGRTTGQDEYTATFIASTP